MIAEAPVVVHGDVEVVTLDRDGVIVAANDAWLGFCRDNGGDPALVGPGVSYLAACDVVADEDPSAHQVAAAVRAAVRGDLPMPMRIRIPCHAPQRERWFDVIVASRYDVDGTCVGGSVTIAPAAPPPSSLVGRWRILDVLPDPVFVLDARLNLEHVNPAALTLLGYPLHRAGTLTLAEIDPELAGQVARNRSVAPWAPGSTGTRIRTLTRADGATLPVEAHVRGVLDDAGTPWIVVTAHDLRLQQAVEARLRAQEESFRVAFDRAPVGAAVIGVDEAGRRTLLRVNAGLAELLGTTVAELVGHDMIEFCYPESAEKDLLAVRAFARGERSDYSRHKRYRRADGVEVWVEARISRVDVPGLAGPTVIAHFVDVTEQHHAEQLRALQAAADAALAQITTAVLAGVTGPELHRLVAETVGRVFGAENVRLGLPDAVTGEYHLAAAVGPVMRLLGDKVKASQAFIRHLVVAGATSLPVLPPDAPAELAARLGPWAAARFGPTDAAVADGGSPDLGSGLISLARLPGEEPFSEAEVGVLARLAQQLSLALELGRARADQERLAVLEDRQRIARDLHDTVVQDLIAIGMQLDAAASRDPDPERARRDETLVDQVEEAVRRLRGSVFDLREPTAPQSVPDTVRAMTAQAARVLGHAPSARIVGDGDGLPHEVGAAVVAVLRESLSNVARHAAASATEVSMTVTTDDVTLVIADDGAGLPAHLLPGDGLANIQRRASLLGGVATISSRPAGGTVVTWSCPLTGTHA